jgi:hypothetical protein
MYIRAAAVTVGLALRAQNADQDLDVADCLRVGVCDALDDQIAQLTEVIKTLNGTPVEPSP